MIRPAVRIEMTRDIATCRALRRAVFIEEQGVSPDDEIDGLDDSAIHLLAYLGDAPVGSARLLRKGDTGKIGRVCVLAPARGTGLGAALIHAAVAQFRAMPGVGTVTLGAQSHATGFYAALGFRAVGEPFIDAGIEHREMVLDL